MRQANKSPKISCSAVVKKIKSDLESTCGSRSTPLLEGHPLPMLIMFGRRPFPRSWIILLTKQQNDRERPKTLLARKATRQKSVDDNAYARDKFCYGSLLDRSWFSGTILFVPRKRSNFLGSNNFNPTSFRHVTRVFVNKLWSRLVFCLF